MSYKVSSLKREKITFTIIIGILLFSLIYISTSTVILRNENLKFKNNIQQAQSEINNLLNFDLPQKDSMINIQRKSIQQQSDMIQKELLKNTVSEKEKAYLSLKLDSLKVEAVALRSKIREVEKNQMERVNMMLSSSESRKDSLLGVYKRELSDLRNKVKILENVASEGPVIETRTLVKEKLTTFYFSARPNDRKNRASKTDFIFIQLQLQGDFSTLNCTSLQVEIRDPNNSIITDQRDRIRASTDSKTEYIFKPLKSSLMKGKYSVKIYCENSDYKHIDFFTLV